MLTRLVSTLAAALLLTGLIGTGADAAATLRVTVTRAVSATTVLTGDSISITGRVSPARTGAPVVLQRYVGGRWGTVRTTTMTSAGTYRLTLSSWTYSSYRYRVVSPADSRRKSGVSASFVAKILTCERSSAPASGRAAWFTRPGLRTTSPIATQIGRLLCSAARGATVNIAMYFIRAGGDVDTILRSLSRVSRYRGVKVRILLEGRLYRSGTPLAPELTALKRYATVVLCQLGCQNERYGEEAKGAIMHHKFISINDMTWASGADPAVVMSSANWSQSQLRYKWQSAALSYRDASLHRETEKQWKILNACAGPGGCATWNDTVAKSSLSPSTDGISQRANLWHSTLATERLGNPGSGTGLTFSTWLAADPVASALRSYSCTPAHRTIRVAHMFITLARLSVIRALQELRAKGCSVYVVVGGVGGAKPGPGVMALREAGVNVTCTADVHDKIVLVDAVRIADGRPDRSVWMGSQSLSGNALRANDEAMLRFSTSGATPTAAHANAVVWNGFIGQWGRIHAKRASCG